MNRPLATTRNARCLTHSRRGSRNSTMKKSREILTSRHSWTWSSRGVGLRAHIPIVLLADSFAELNRMIVDFVIQFHAWASSRPRHERNVTARRLEGQINDILKTEEEQGTSHSQSVLGMPCHHALTLVSRSYTTVSPFSLSSPLPRVERTREFLLQSALQMRQALAAISRGLPP